MARGVKRDDQPDEQASNKMKLQLAWQQAHRAGVVALCRVAPFGIQVLVSAVAYGAGIGAAQLLGAGLKVSCNTRVVSSVMGMAGVGAASALAGHMGRHAKVQLESGKHALDMLKAPFWDDVQLQEVAIDAVTGMFFFKVLGGTFRRVMPSDLRFPGACAYQSLPVGAAEHATPLQKRDLIVAFRRDGCHHCGIRRGNVIGDHIPPTKVFKEVQAAALAAEGGTWQKAVSQVRTTLGLPAPTLVQRYFAQCVNCSNKQSTVVKLGRRSPIKLHRWMLTPGAVPGILVGLRAYVPPMLPPPPPRGGSGGGGGGGNRRAAGTPSRNSGNSSTTTGGGRGGMWAYSQRLDASPGALDQLFHSQLAALALDESTRNSPACSARSTLHDVEQQSPTMTPAL